MTRPQSGTGRPRVAENGGSADHCPNQLVQDPLFTGTGRACCRERKKPVPEGPFAQTVTSPQAIAAFRVQALERSRFAVGRLPAAYGDWSARPLACRSE